MHGAVINASAIVGCNCIINSQALVEHDTVIGDHCHVATAAAINAAENATPSHSGGVGMRQCGSMEACHATTFCESQSNPPAALATHAQSVKTATNPSGTAKPSSGTTKALAERPEKPTRWK